MRKIVSAIMILAMVFTDSSAFAAASGLWTKYSAPDGSYSFHYPKGWKVEADESAIAVNNLKTDEEMVMTVIPYDKSKSPTALATGFINLVKKNSPNLRATNWRTASGTINSQVVFDLTDKSNNKQYNGTAMVLKENQQATWFSYIAPSSGYSRDRGLALLQGFIGSLAAGPGSVDPKINYDASLTAKIDANANAFMFVLEFALGAPFTENQEQVILDELKSDWRLMPEKELAAYDQYPALVKTILSMGQKDLEELRSDLEKSFTVKERQQIATAPGLWVCLRTLLSNGSRTEQEKVRSGLLKLTPESQSAKGGVTSETAKNPVMSMQMHNTLMAIQQTTFNTYMWSRGYNYSPAFGKMW